MSLPAELHFATVWFMFISNNQTGKVWAAIESRNRKRTTSSILALACSHFAFETKRNPNEECLSAKEIAHRQVSQRPKKCSGLSFKGIRVVVSKIGVAIDAIREVPFPVHATPWNLCAKSYVV